MIEKSQIPPARSCIDAAVTGLVFYCFTTLLVAVGVVASASLPHVPLGPRYFDSRMASGNGEAYRSIAQRGYSYDPGKPSRVAYFPAFPLLGRWVARASGVRTEMALVVVANVCLVATFVLAAGYTRTRLAGARADIVGWTLMALGIFPTTFFFRMGQSESLFLLTCVGAMYAMERQAHPLVTALIIGLGTATRPVGILLLGPFALHLWQQHRGKNPRTSLFRFVGGAAIWLPLSCWGIAAFMVFQYATFGDALGFFHTQQHCGQRPAAAYWEQWSRALVLEPIWSVYDPSSAAYWANRERAPGNPLGNLAFANPIYCVISAALVAVGWRKGWLNGRETLLAALLLAIPYLTHSHRNLMLSQGRFAAVAFPVYLVLGRLMACAPLPLVVVGCSLSGFLLITYAALFAAGYELN